MYIVNRYRGSELSLIYGKRTKSRGNVTAIIIFLAVIFSILNGCSGKNEVHHHTLDLSDTLEQDRLSYFQEIGLDSVIEEYGLTGKGVYVTIMGEIIDPRHPELIGQVEKQYNTITRPGQILEGIGELPFGYEFLGYNAGHGTHIAGTVAALKDGQGIQGIAPHSRLLAYDIGAYGIPEIHGNDTENLINFLPAFASALTHLTKSGKSSIATGSFNLEAPYIRYKPGSRLEGKPLLEINELLGNIGSVTEFFNSELVEFVNEEEAKFLERMVEDNEDDSTIIFMSLFPLTAEWKILESAIAEYQKSGGVYIVTESNYVFDGRTSVLNAMPTISDKVDPDLWLSVSMMVPDLSEDEWNSIDLDEGRAAFMDGPYISPLNTCGSDAENYGIITPSYAILSAMPESICDPDSPLLWFDNRSYQEYDGHSMGAPMVAAALALMEEYNQKENLGLSMRQLVRILKESARRDYKGYDPRLHGQGMLNVGAAIAEMAALER